MRLRVAAAAIGAGLVVLGSATLDAGAASLTSASSNPVTKPLSSLGSLTPAPNPGRIGPEGIPVPRAQQLAGLHGAASGRTVDGIRCETSEQLLFHIHTHLTIFVNGTPRQIPYGIGIPGAQVEQTSSTPFVDSGTCFYWLHVHAADGVIHIESPVHRTFTLGQFFDEWGQPLGPDQVGPAQGPVTVFYDGRVYVGNPRNVPLGAHAQIQLDVGLPLVSPEKVKSWNGL